MKKPDSITQFILQKQKAGRKIEFHKHIKSHLEETALLAEKFAGEFGYGDWGYFCGMLHDIGKYSAKFQGRIRGSGETADHAMAGAQLCLKLGKERGSID